MPQVSGATVSIATSPSPSNKMETIQQVVSHYVPLVQGEQLFSSDNECVCVCMCVCTRVCVHARAHTCVLTKRLCGWFEHGSKKMLAVQTHGSCKCGCF